MDKEYTRKILAQSGLFEKDEIYALLEDRDYTIENADEVIQQYRRKIIKE